jgi:hypothetical protein
MYESIDLSLKYHKDGILLKAVSPYLCTVKMIKYK